MGLLIDASILIEAERGRLGIARFLRDRPTETAFLSVVTASELLHGVHRAKDEHIMSRRSHWVEEILVRIPLLPVDLATARVHARISADLASQGTPIGPHDLWIAATCLVHGFSIATANIREFNRVPGLAVDAWPAS